MSNYATKNDGASRSSTTCRGFTAIKLVGLSLISMIGLALSSGADATIVPCLEDAAKRFNHRPAILQAILEVESGGNAQ